MLLRLFRGSSRLRVPHERYKSSKVGQTRYARSVKKEGDKQKAEERLCRAYATAEEYSWKQLRELLESHGGYTLNQLPEDATNVLHAKTENGELFFFSFGAMVCWNLSKPQLVEARKIISAAQLHPYANSLVERENEEFSYSYEKANSQLANGQIVLREDSDQENQRLERLAFSNAMALSVKLAMWECALDEFIESINWVPQSLKEGQLRKLSRKNVLQKTGTLVALSHEINLRSDLLENPDFYWDRPQLEELYSQTCKHLDVHFRTRVVNKKLDHCSDLVELLRTQLNERHSHRLEWLIICLIGTEIVLDLVGYLN